jgi:hypothetical protein
MSQIMLKNVRLSFPSLFKRAVFQGTEGKYEATFLISKDDKETIATINKAIDQLVAENKINKAAIPTDKLCFRDGDTFFNKDGEPLDGYQGHMSFKAASNQAVQVVDQRKLPITEEDNKVYAGCYVNAIVGLWYQNNAYGRRINGNLYAVQFVKDGDAFGSAPSNAASLFENLESDDDLDF